MTRGEPSEAPTASITFGELLRKHGVAAGLTQELLAARAGLSVHGIQKLEHGATRPYQATVERLAVTLELSPDDQALFWTSGRPAPRERQSRSQLPISPKRLYGHNLPTSLTSFVGREHELADLRVRLAEARLLTLTGVGGCGKTRLALEFSRTVVDQYPGGVWLVEHAPLADAAFVPQTVAAALDVRETPGQPIASTVAAALRGQTMLLVLDNCEHLLEACAQFVDALLRTCPGLHVLATSREALRITGEIARRVPSLPVPDFQHVPPLAELQQNPAVRLFVERATAVQARFVLTEHNAPAVAQVCQRLDGIPLALELAAGRIEALTVEQLAARLDQRFRLLTGGNRAALPRQQTLRAALDWSYDLLSEPERLLLNRLSVFAGGWTLEASETVCSGDGIDQDDVLDLLAQLVRKSMVAAQEEGDGAERYQLQETLRQYADERLTAAGEAETVRERHASYYLTLAEEAAPRGTVEAWPARLLIEHDNLRAAMRWLSQSKAVERAMRLGGLLYTVWVFGGYLTEGRAELRTLLAMPGASRASADWAQLMWSAGFLEFFAGDFVAARAMMERAAALRRTIGDPLLAHTLSFLGQAAREQGDYAAARKWLEESVELAQEQDDRNCVAITLDGLGTIAHALGDLYLGDVSSQTMRGTEGEIDRRRLVPFEAVA